MIKSSSVDHLLQFSQALNSNEVILVEEESEGHDELQEAVAENFEDLKIKRLSGRSKGCRFPQLLQNR